MDFLTNFDVLYNEPMKNHTTFKIGGPCEALIRPHSEEELLTLIKGLREGNKPLRIIGNGSNLLVSDRGLREWVVKIDDNLSAISREGHFVFAQAGAKMKDVADFAAAKALSGFERLSGIPGNVGGAITMNAGAYEREIKDVLHSCYVIDHNNQIKEIPGSEMNLSYRHSRVFDEELIVVKAVFNLTPGIKEDILEEQNLYEKKRRDRQPLQDASAGSTFKRPVGHFAGQLIQNAGLSGFSIGGAMVSPKHSGFVINTGDACAQDVLDLIEYIQKIVQEKYNVTLEPEVRIIGE